MAVLKPICDLKRTDGCRLRSYQYYPFFYFVMFYVLFSSRESSRSGKPVARADGLKVSVEINARDTFFLPCFFNDFLLCLSQGEEIIPNLINSLQANNWKERQEAVDRFVGLMQLNPDGLGTKFTKVCLKVLSVDGSSVMKKSLIFHSKSAEIC